MTVLQHALGEGPPPPSDDVRPARAAGDRGSRTLPAGRPPLRFRARHLLPVILVLSAVWVVLVFARSLSESDAVSQRVASISAENELLRARLEAGRAEVELIQRDEFLRLQARAFGFGERGERVFALHPDTPPPASIVPLGADPRAAEPPRPLDDWLDLLLGGRQPPAG